MISPNMKAILSLFTHPDQEVKKTDIVAAYGGSYYHNGHKYIGDILTRMIKNGLLERVKPGTYKRGLNYKGRAGKIKNGLEDKNQLNLF